MSAMRSVTSPMAHTLGTCRQEHAASKVQQLQGCGLCHTQGHKPCRRKLWGPRRHTGQGRRAGAVQPGTPPGKVPPGGTGKVPRRTDVCAGELVDIDGAALGHLHPQPLQPQVVHVGAAACTARGGGGAGTRGDISANATHCKGSIRAQDQQCNISSGAAAAACLWLPARGRTPPQTTPMPAGEENRGRRKAQNERARGRVCGEAADRHLNAGMQACLRGRWLGPTPTRRPPAAAAQLDVVVAPQPT